MGSINFRSPKQLKELLYTTMALPIQTVREQILVTTNEKALENCIEKQEMRFSTYITAQGSF